MEISTKNLTKCVYKEQFFDDSFEVVNYLEKKYRGKRESKKNIEIIDGEEYYYCGKGRWYFGVVYWIFRRLSDDKVIMIGKRGI